MPFFPFSRPVPVQARLVGSDAQIFPPSLADFCSFQKGHLTVTATRCFCLFTPSPRVNSEFAISAFLRDFKNARWVLPYSLLQVCPSPGCPYNLPFASLARVVSRFLPSTTWPTDPIWMRAVLSRAHVDYLFSSSPRLPLPPDARVGIRDSSIDIRPGFFRSPDRLYSSPPLLIPSLGTLRTACKRRCVLSR